MKMSLQHVCLAVVTAVSIWGGSLGNSLAQAAPLTSVLAQATNQNQAASTGSKSWVLEGGLVVVLMGVAWFAICKSSRRS